MDGDEDEGAFEPEPPSKKATAKPKSKKKAPTSSSSEDDSESEEETWGRTKGAYYSSNAAQLESDDEEANELEEQEARRLQAKMREAMAEDDFGLGDDVEDVSRATDADALLEPVPGPREQLPQDKKSLIRHLEKTSPETLSLARDWEETAYNLVKTQQKISTLESEEPDALSLGMIHLHYQALLTYATTLAFYLHLRASEPYVQRPELLRTHPVLSRLLTLKQSISTLEDLDFDVSESDLDNAEDPDETVGGSDEDEDADMEQLWKLDKKKGLEADELEALLKEAGLEADLASRNASTRAEEPEPEPPKKKRKTAKKALPVFDLVEPTFPSSSKPSSSSSRAEADVIDAYGEATSLQHADAADKRSRTKSLRFHTSRIESASARRQGARNTASGGDDDIPYRERKKEKDQRMAKEAKAKVRGQGGDDLDDKEPEAADKKRRRDDDDEGSDGGKGDGADGYYELVKRKAKESKEKKKADYEAAQAAAKPDFGVDGATGPRSLTRAILNNRGLTPHRSKSVRNPRVKKRQKFEKAKKKVASQKAIYKGGIGDSGKYDGERSGISKVVKSVRLG
ncbi:hypothetical protein PLICRDRAFT_43637 [Plicaturopsis crispa FD-325 SS-3]|nr:hypothetical protein PLICRDRAFT_43637 [Plicaturopsis crispa FD-325 SS-3]